MPFSLPSKVPLLRHLRLQRGGHGWLAWHLVQGPQAVGGPSRVQGPRAGRGLDPVLLAGECREAAVQSASHSREAPRQCKLHGLWHILILEWNSETFAHECRKHMCLPKSQVESQPPVYWCLEAGPLGDERMICLWKWSPRSDQCPLQSRRDLALLLPLAESAQREDGRLPAGKPFPTRCGIYPCLVLASPAS